MAVDLDENGKPTKWMVENSWGPASGYQGHLITVSYTHLGYKQICHYVSSGLPVCLLVIVKLYQASSR